MTTPTPSAPTPSPVEENKINNNAWHTPQSNWAYWLERIALFFEKPINRLTGTNQLNPLYHTGTIASFLLMVVGVTGVYLFMFFQYGFDASHSATMRIEANSLGFVLRAIHNYASGALVITTLLHAYRMLFMENFRGPRWLAWSTGMVITAFLWIAGITGYWLIWDERAQLLNKSFARFLDIATPWSDKFQVYLVTAARNDTNWPFLMALFVVHVILFVTTAVFFYIHLLRLKRAKWLPNEYWTMGMGIILLIFSILFPLGVLTQANPALFPGMVKLDPIFLFFLPITNATANFAIWMFLIVGGVVFTLLPFWLKKRKQINSETGETAVCKPAVISIVDDHCTGCTLCAADCPYGALEMVERGADAQHKFIAVVEPDLCVGCGICIGSCNFDAIKLGENPSDLLWTMVDKRIEKIKAQSPTPRIVFVCERHAAHEAQSYMTTGECKDNTEVVVVPCAGAIPPALLTKGVADGITEMRVVGCPPNDCMNREGNTWTSERLMRRRLPRLNKKYVDEPITAVWAAPNEFIDAINQPPRTMLSADGGDAVPNYSASRRLIWPVEWRNYGAALVLLAIVMLMQILLTRLPYNAYPEEPTAVQITIPDPTEPYGYYLNTDAIASGDTSISLAIDGETVFEQVYDATAVLSDNPPPIYSHIKVDQGERDIQLIVVNGDDTLVLFDKSVAMEPRDILNLGATRNLRIATPTPQEK